MGALANAPFIGIDYFLLFPFVVLGLHFISFPIGVLLWAMKDTELPLRRVHSAILAVCCVFLFSLAYLAFHALRSF